MSWPSWPKGNEKALAGYAMASTGNAIRALLKLAPKRLMLEG